MDKEKLPRVKLVGEDGNIYSIVGRASRALRKAGLSAKIEEMCARVSKAKNYDEALGIVTEYVEPY